MTWTCNAVYHLPAVIATLPGDIGPPHPTNKMNPTPFVHYHCLLLLMAVGNTANNVLEVAISWVNDSSQRLLRPGYPSSKSISDLLAMVLTNFVRLVLGRFCPITEGNYLLSTDTAVPRPDPMLLNNEDP